MAPVCGLGELGGEELLDTDLPQRRHTPSNV